MLIYLGWITAAFLAGILFTEWFRHLRPSLQVRARKAAVFRGKTYREVLRDMKEPQATVRRPDGSTLRTWREDGYSITLLFDARDTCLGVDDEQY